MGITSDKSEFRLATYGTLAPGRANHAQLKDLQGRWTEGTVRGRLVQAGWGAALGFPALVLDPEGQNVEVFIFESAELPDHWDRLDAFEGEGYQRVETLVNTDDGSVSAFIYVVAEQPREAGAGRQRAGIGAFPLKTTDKLRYADTDRQGHINNAVFNTFLETGRVELLYGDELMLEGAAFVIARLELDFLAEINWPGTVEIGTAVKEVGRSSFKLFQRVFQDGTPVAEAVTIIVQMNDTTRRSVPLSENARERLAELVRPALST
ncbi:thioesterase family protein [Roseibium sp. HPY-6]|uniref:thioesterase family protein n=1 Tax=Roseibium sp. HPY-6 TaxID=3229852 RepID=UPI00338F6093